MNTGNDVMYCRLIVIAMRSKLAVNVLIVMSNACDFRS